MRRWRTVITLTLAVLLVGGAAFLGYRMLIDPTDDGDDAADPLAPALEPTTWDVYTRKGDLTIQYDGSACQEASEAVVEERADRVVVTLRTKVAAEECTEEATRYQVRVRLRKALDGREVYDGACLMGDQPQRMCLRSVRGSEAA
ncbi:hypothetical protein [Nocardioides stalactiti]|uniref:hypothetical protein n=1 Tax=Nocardioides stalactiti TaxID=2755356 RepID=UPI0016014AF0|nr:hypothetical protein [Nocardioides stalactiti]